MFRNDDLYKATTEKPTSSAYGLVPLIDRNLYKRPAPGSSPSTSNGSKTASFGLLPSPNRDVAAEAAQKNQPAAPARNAANSDLPGPAVVQRPANRPLRRPYRRRRPQVDYYYYDDEYEDDFYDDRGRRRQQRPRNRRPLYDDYRFKSFLSINQAL